MTCTTKGMPTAGYLRLRHNSQGGSTDFHRTTGSDESVCAGEDDRVLAILAMGSNDVPPILVRRAIDEHWSVEEAAQTFKQLAKAG